MNEYLQQQNEQKTQQLWEFNKKNTQNKHLECVNWCVEYWNKHFRCNGSGLVRQILFCFIDQDSRLVLLFSFYFLFFFLNSVF